MLNRHKQPNQLWGLSKATNQYFILLTPCSGCAFISITLVLACSNCSILSVQTKPPFTLRTPTININPPQIATQIFMHSPYLLLFLLLIVKLLQMKFVLRSKYGDYMVARSRYPDLWAKCTETG